MGHDGQRTLVESVRDTGRWEAVYNVEVGGTHTYFVGNAEWGCSLWAHNMGYGDELAKLTNQGIQNVRSRLMNLLKTELHHIATDKGTHPSNRWREVFEHLFAGAGMRLDDPMNLIRIQGRAGPHGIYNTDIFTRLFRATQSFARGTPEYRRALRTELAYIRVELRSGTGTGALIRERVGRNSFEQLFDRDNSRLFATIMGL